jgi:hypothetical protein
MAVQTRGMKMRGRSGAGWLAAGIALAAIMTDAVPVAAQDADRNPPAAARRVPARVTVYPLSRYHRKCDFWLAVEHRPSGDVITPQQKCVWALR